MSLNLSLSPKPASAAGFKQSASLSEQHPAAYVEGFTAGVNAERAKWVEAGALKGNEPATAKAKAEPDALAWDAIVDEINAKAGLSAPVKG